LSTQLNAKNEEINKLVDSRDAILDDVKKTYSNLPVSIQVAMAARTAKPVNDQIKTMSYEADRLSADLKYETDLQKNEFDLIVKQKEEEAANAKEARAYQFQAAQQMQNQAFQKQQNERNFAQQKEFANIQDKYQQSRDVLNYKQDLQKLGITDAMQTNRDLMNFEQQKQFAAIQNKYQNSRDVQGFNQDMSKLQYQASLIAPQTTSAPSGELASGKFSTSIQPTKNVTLDSAALE